MDFTCRRLSSTIWRWIARSTSIANSEARSSKGAIRRLSSEHAEGLQGFGDARQAMCIPHAASSTVGSGSAEQIGASERCRWELVEGRSPPAQLRGHLHRCLGLPGRNSSVGSEDCSEAVLRPKALFAEIRLIELLEIVVEPIERIDTTTWCAIYWPGRRLVLVFADALLARSSSAGLAQVKGGGGFGHPACQITMPTHRPTDFAAAPHFTAPR